MYRCSPVEDLQFVVAVCCFCIVQDGISKTVSCSNLSLLGRRVRVNVQPAWRAQSYLLRRYVDPYGYIYIYLHLMCIFRSMSAGLRHPARGRRFGWHTWPSCCRPGALEEHRLGGKPAGDETMRDKPQVWRLASGLKHLSFLVAGCLFGCYADTFE